MDLIKTPADLAKVLGVTSNADKVLRLIVSLGLVASARASGDYARLAEDVTAKAATARHLLHLNNLPAQVAGLKAALAANDPVLAVSNALVAGFYLCEHLVLIANLKPASILNMDSGKWLRRSAMFMCVYFIINAVKDAVALAQLQLKLTSKSTAEELDRRNTLALTAMSNTLEIGVALTRSQLRVVYTNEQVGVVGFFAASVGLIVSAKRLLGGAAAKSVPKPESSTGPAEPAAAVAPPPALPINAKPPAVAASPVKVTSPIPSADKGPPPKPPVDAAKVAPASPAVTKAPPAAQASPISSAGKAPPPAPPTGEAAAKPVSPMPSAGKGPPPAPPVSPPKVQAAPIPSAGKPPPPSPPAEASKPAVAPIPSAGKGPPPAPPAAEAAKHTASPIPSAGKGPPPPPPA